MAPLYTSSTYLIHLCIVLVILLSMTLSVSAQYQPMVVESANWIAFSGVEKDDSRIYSIEGDTIIDGVTYGKLFERIFYTDALFPREVTQPYIAGAPRLKGFLRDESLERTVYGKIYSNVGDSSSLSIDTVIHDFKVAVGDKIYNYDYADTVTVGSIDTMFRYEAFRVSISGQFADTLLEGIGSLIYGPIGLRNLLLNEGAPALIDYCLGSLAECGIDQLVSLKPNLLIIPISIFPVPAILGAVILSEKWGSTDLGGVKPSNPCTSP